MVSQIYPSELQLNKANASDTEAAFLDLHLSISNDIVSTKIYDKRDDPLQLRSLICAFVVCHLECIIAVLAAGTISRI